MSKQSIQRNSSQTVMKTGQPGEVKFSKITTTLKVKKPLRRTNKSWRTKQEVWPQRSTTLGKMPLATLLRMKQIAGGKSLGNAS